MGLFSKIKEKFKKTEFVSNEKVEVYEKGLEKGLEQAYKKIAQKMLEEKIDINVIITITGLSKEEIEKLK